jgi:hypothetical protein
MQFADDTAFGSVTLAARLSALAVFWASAGSVVVCSTFDVAAFDVGLGASAGEALAQPLPDADIFGDSDFVRRRLRLRLISACRDPPARSGVGHIASRQRQAALPARWRKPEQTLRSE